jgi:predicted membrane protein
MNTRSKKQGIVWGGLLIVFGVLALIETVTNLNAWIWVAVLVVGGLVVYAIYATDRTERWLLIISYAMLAVAGLVTLLTLGALADPYVATYVLLAIGLPFFVAFLFNRDRWGFLIPAYVLLAIAVFVPLSELGVLNDTLTVTYVLLAVALPFYVVFFLNTRNWWALIPAGILTVIGLAFLIAEASVEYIFAAALIVAGILILVRQLTKGEQTPQVEELPGEEPEDA